MKLKEAIMTLTRLKDRTDSYGGKCIDAAIEAIERQVPKKPIKEMVGPGWLWTCPSCGLLVDETDEHPFCDNCGQAILWEEDND